MAELPGGVAVQVHNLRKAYNAVPVLTGLDLEVRRGEIFALLGPNGAGKTTTVEILEGYRRRDSGQVAVLGCDPGSQRNRLKARIGIVFQSTGVEPNLSVRETVAMYAGFYPQPRPVGEVLELVGLSAQSEQRVIRLSGGQQRRLDVAIALAGDPELLFLDEPTTGFDPAARHEAWVVVKNLATLGKTVVLTTHYMDEAQYLADQVAVIVGGRVIAQGPPSTLGMRDRSHVRVRYRPSMEVTPPPPLWAPPGPDGYVEIDVERPEELLHQLTGWALEHQVHLEGLEVTRPSLEEVYLHLTNGLAASSG